MISEAWFSSSKGPEAGVWVIAETMDQPTRFAKIVVTTIAAGTSYRTSKRITASVRGYGLIDSQKIKTPPGKNLNLTAVAAPDAPRRPRRLPAGYWASLIGVPGKTTSLEPAARQRNSA